MVCCLRRGSHAAMFETNERPLKHFKLHLTCFCKFSFVSLNPLVSFCQWQHQSSSIMAHHSFLSFWWNPSVYYKRCTCHVSDHHLFYHLYFSCRYLDIWSIWTLPLILPSCRENWRASCTCGVRPRVFHFPPTTQNHLEAPSIARDFSVRFVVLTISVRVMLITAVNLYSSISLLYFLRSLMLIWNPFFILLCRTVCSMTLNAIHDNIIGNCHMHQKKKEKIPQDPLPI